VTNDFPPKIGAIQSYLWELWRRLPPERVTVLTTPYAGDSAFDATQPMRIERTSAHVLLPTPGLARRVRSLAAEVGASLVVLDPALPLSLLGPELGLPYAVVVHGAEVSVPGRLPGGRAALRRALRAASLVVACGQFVLDEVRRVAGSNVPAVIVPPGVDVERFRPVSDEERRRIRLANRLSPDARLVAAVTRLVPRKGMDTLIAAAALLVPRFPDLTVAIAGTGRDRARLERLVAGSGAPVHFLGRIPSEDLPTFLASADVFAMPCRNRWWGLEQEGFGIVFLEAAACAVPQVAGDSGGADEAVVHGETGWVVAAPEDPGAVAHALEALLADDDLRRTLGGQARERAERGFEYGKLAAALDRALLQVEA
jgi:phosphatidylinositol alpha-1,6-mannosyltransferase